jgi:hypothetical protein
VWPIPSVTAFPASRRPICRDTGGARFLHRELGVRMDVGVDTFQRGKEILDSRFE